METTTLGRQFVEFALKVGALEIIPEGRKLKSGRVSPYFFNAGLFKNGSDLYPLGLFYAYAIMEMEKGKSPTTLIYGQAYKGCALALATAMVFGLTFERPVGFAFNRKEVKDHGEGGLIVGCPIKGNQVAIVDDVVTNGDTKREALKIVRAEGGTVAGIVIAFDRQEQVTGNDHRSARTLLTQEFGIPVVAIANAEDLLAVLEQRMATDKRASTGYSPIKEYLRHWGATG